MKTNWNDIFKIRIREAKDEQTKHLIVKTLIVQKLLIKYNKQKNFIRIYTEFEAVDGKICDVYFENTKTKEAYAFEVQKGLSKRWRKETIEKYKDWDVPMMRTSDLIIVDLNKLSDNLKELEAQVKELIV